ncbi:hypothetical protein OsccyDRAFT_0769 [Leptolyngbyaceae cyanobacterium JSC-12]|nr:hypothetical protein OsccyDRAFT_0769 [Leptolyngbyaceae cyanobacterium JSC-12]
MPRSSLGLFLRGLSIANSVANQHLVVAAFTLWLFGCMVAPVIATATEGKEASSEEHPLAIAQISEPQPPLLPQATSTNDAPASEKNELPTLGDLIAQTLQSSSPSSSNEGTVAEASSDSTLHLAQLTSPLPAQLPVPYPPSSAKGKTPPPPPTNLVDGTNPGQPSQPTSVSPPGYLPYGMVLVPMHVYGGTPVGFPAGATLPLGSSPPKLAPLPYPVMPYGTAPLPTGYSYGAVPGTPIIFAPQGMPAYPAHMAPAGAPLPALPRPMGYAVYPGNYPLGNYPSGNYPSGMMLPPIPYSYGISLPSNTLPAAPSPHSASTPGMALPPPAYPYGMVLIPPGAYPTGLQPSVYPIGVPPTTQILPTGVMPFPAYPVPSPEAQFPQAQPLPVQSPQGQPLLPLPSTPTPGTTSTNSKPLIRSTALNQPELKFQGAYIYQGSEGSGRARVTGTLPLTPRVLVGGTLDFVDGRAFTDSENQGINLNELYVATSIPDLPNLRFVVGQLDLTSYFDRNSFAKDGASMFFNPVFQTNPALAATGIGSRQAALVNWSITDNAEAKAAIFSSSRELNDFSVDGFAGELGIRFGNTIVRGTYATNRDGGRRDGFREIFQVDRGNGRTGLLRDDREEAFGINAETYFPDIKMGIFGRYGHYYNRGINRTANTYSFGVTFLDLLTKNDRLGIAYGRELSNESLRRRAGDRKPDVFEVFYDFALLPNLRLGFSFQAADNFSETILGIRVKTDFDLIAPRQPR